MIAWKSRPWYNEFANPDGELTMSIAKTRKGRMTIPKDVRDMLGIAETDYVQVVVDGGKAVLSPVRGSTLSDLKGRLPATRPYPGADAIRREVGEKLGEEMGRREE